MTNAKYYAIFDFSAIVFNLAAVAVILTTLSLI